ncbi:hypothetical protein SKAU_G00391600 [Synaphobranchus kaupii]|uniref:Catenin alpha-2 n=1 Tax=Synaphobranchus kaupii TaxID=118154 RepID=A0A9Q1IBN1_SYNKA|nr:hypothetical protein SKAU_G00391600 [Synaphobranchus kaupii]
MVDVGRLWIFVDVLKQSAKITAVVTEPYRLQQFRAVGRAATCDGERGPPAFAPRRVRRRTRAGAPRREGNKIILDPLTFSEARFRPSLEERLESIISGAALMADSSCTRDDRRERIVAECNAVRQALQDLLSEYMNNSFSPLFSPSPRLHQRTPPRLPDPAGKKAASLNASLRFIRFAARHGEPAAGEPGEKAPAV